MIIEIDLMDTLIAFDWSTVRKGGIVIDVGGGLGHVSMEVSKIRPDLNIVVEDRPPVMVQAKAVRSQVLLEGYLLTSLKYWEEHLPNRIATGNVQFIGRFHALKLVILVICAFQEWISLMTNQLP